MLETLGLCPALEEKMHAVNANVLMEDGLMLRTCACGVRHPVGHTRPEHWDSLQFQATREEGALHAHASRFCCTKECCKAWVASPIESR